jgi:hypothetical protein
MTRNRTNNFAPVLFFATWFGAFSFVMLRFA